MSLSFRCTLGMSFPHFRGELAMVPSQTGDRVSDQIEIRGLISLFAADKEQFYSLEPVFY